LQVGAGNDANDRIAISIGSAKVSALGIGSNSSYSITLGAGIPVPTTTLVAGTLSINGAQIGASVTDGVSYADAEGSAIAKAAAINAASGLTGVTAKVGKTTITSATPTATATINAAAIVINGADIGSIRATNNPIDRGTQIAAAINAKSSQTGVTATSNTNGAAGDLGKVTLTAADGRNIVIKSTAAGIAGSGLGVTDGVADTTSANITLSTNSSTGIVIGGSTGATATGQTVGYSPSVLSSTGGVDLSTATGSQAALSVLDAAINTVTDSRASMGAYQNRLTASIANLESTSMNMQASRSRILDADYAKETTNLAKAQIIQQAATAMLAQANQSSQSVLALLK